MLVVAIISMCLALTFYTLGVFMERKSGSLKLKHIILFGCGLVFDTTGTTIMRGLFNPEITASVAMLHKITGAGALLIMALHFIWAIYTYFKGNEKAKESFHRFSIVAWSFWLIPFVIGMIIGMTH